nr:NUDIX hydrolase [Rhizobium sp. SSA_523]
MRDRWINVRADRCVTASGARIEPYYVLSYPDWVNVVAITARQELVFVRQYRHAIGDWVTELPGGIADQQDEALHLSARRELLEETGYETAADLEPVCALHANPATHTNTIHTFLCRQVVLERDPVLEAGEDGLQVVLMPIAQAIALLRSGGFASAMHAAGLSLALMAAGYLKG